MEVKNETAHPKGIPLEGCFWLKPTVNVLLEWICLDSSGSEKLPRRIKGRLVTCLGEGKGFPSGPTDDPLRSVLPEAASPALPSSQTQCPHWPAVLGRSQLPNPERDTYFGKGGQRTPGSSDQAQLIPGVTALSAQAHETKASEQIPCCRALGKSGHAACSSGPEIW